MDCRRGQRFDRAVEGRGAAAPPASLLPSRSRALAEIVAAVEAGDGPWLLTGVAGVGKTWLWRFLRDQSPGPIRWAHVDVRPDLAPADFHREIARALGLGDLAGSGDPRPVVADWLAERDADGERWGLVIDEGQNARSGLLEEVRLLTNRLGDPSGFDSLGLVGQTPLLRRMATRAGSPLGVRLSARVHLRPLDADEAATFLAGRSWDAAEIASTHRLTGGVPLALARLAGHRSASAIGLAAPPTVAEPAPAADSLVGPDRPPIHVDEGMIEVGWQPDSGDEGGAEDDEDEPVDAPAEEGAADHYAAIEAWDDWTQSQPAPGPSAMAASPPDRAEPRVDLDDESAPAATPDRAGSTHHRPEGPHGFAPYGLLFSKLRNIKDAE